MRTIRAGSKHCWQTSLVIPRLRLHASNAGGTGSIPCRGTKIPQVTLCGQTKKKNKTVVERKLMRSCKTSRTMPGTQRALNAFSYYNYYCVSNISVFHGKRKKKNWSGESLQWHFKTLGKNKCHSLSWICLCFSFHLGPQIIDHCYCMICCCSDFHCISLWHILYRVWPRTWSCIIKYIIYWTDHFVFNQPVSYGK